jgi:heat shock protein HslJ
MNAHAMRTGIAAIMVAALLQGCAANDTGNKAALPPLTPIMVPPTMKSSDEPKLKGRAWTWQRTDLRGERIAPDAPANYTIEFGDDDRLQVRADCNRGGAAYTARTDRTLSISPVATTKMGCPAGSRGAEFVRQLADVDGYDFVDGDLVLTLKANAGAMRFAAIAK